MFDRNSKKVLTCASCGATWEIDGFDDPDIWLEPWPRLECSCGSWVPVF